uniref:Uncharacterized protein n=1 Tax=Arundo donax TaxID=35708 RepID=A0A0A9F512_ARUDO
MVYCHLVAGEWRRMQVEERTERRSRLRKKALCRGRECEVFVDRGKDERFWSRGGK